MFDSWERFKELLGRLVNPAASRQPSGRRRLQVEALEERWCPAGTWAWNAPAAGGNWSSPANWQLNGAAVPVGVGQQYPGGPGANADDQVFFANNASGPATLDVGIGAINTLKFAGWNDVLTLNTPLTVTGQLGAFSLADRSTITMANPNANLTLNALGTAPMAPGNVWSSGTITGGANTALVVSGGTGLLVTLTPAGLGTQMTIGTGSGVMLAGMTGNLNLTAASNYIDVSGALYLNQQVAPGRQNLDGGIGFVGHNLQLPAVQVESGGSLSQGALPLAGGVFGVVGAVVTVGFPPAALNQVSIAGAVYNLGGAVQVNGAQNSLDITGQDANSRSYWQEAGANSNLVVTTAGANITASGTYQIDVGTVCLTATSNGVAALDNLDGAGLIFGNANTAYLEITDSTAGVPGTVSVGGPVTLAANTILKMNFSGANNTADLLNVQGGALTLAGTLQLNSVDNQLPTLPLNFFTDSGAAPSLVGSFGSITNSAKMNANYNFWIDQSNPNDYTWEVAIS